MSIIQQIQEKYAKLMAIIIAIALIIFVVMLAFENGGSLFRGSNSQLVGKVNGREILYRPFEQKVEQQEAYMKQSPYGPQGPAVRYQAIDATWGQEVNRLLILSEADKLGLEVTKREMGDILYGSNPPNDLKQSFTDSATGLYDGIRAKQEIDARMKSNPELKEQFNAYFNNLEVQRLSEKYTSLLSNSTNYPQWLIEKQNAENGQIATVSYVTEAYSSIPDSTVTVSDKEIEDYIKAHKDDFTQKEETRSIAYVTFSALPSAADSAKARQTVLDAKPEFDTTDDVKSFLERNGVTNFYNSYISGNRIQIQQKDSFLRIPVGTTYGPFVEGNSYAIAKLLGVKTQPDTVDVRHILIGLNQTDPQTGQSYPVRDSAAAYKLADSLRNAIARGSSFDSLCLQFTDDPGSRADTGVYRGVPSGQMVETFNDFIFGNPVGSKGLVNTSYGTHYVEILKQKGSSPAYKVAYLTAPIEVSNETDQNALTKANAFAGATNDIKSFDANVEKGKSQGIFKAVQDNITANTYQLNVGPARSFVKKIFDADLGDVIEPEKIGTNYVVAIVTGIQKKGLRSVASSRTIVEPAIRNRKKAEIIAAKLKNATTLEAVAAAWGGKPIQTVDSLRLDGSVPGMSPIADEIKAVGAAFNPANKGKITPPIYGQSGVIVLRVDNITPAPITPAGTIDDQRKQRYEQGKANVYPYGSLMEAANIKDNRIKFF